MIEPTDEQLEIYRHDPNKHACIIAGPGTGKSTTLIEYVGRLHKQFPGKVIRLLTFTRAANGELIDKKSETGQDWIVSSTVHSFAITTILANPGATSLPAPLRIADDWELKELIRRDLARRLSVNVKQVKKLEDKMGAEWESLSSEIDWVDLTPMRARFMGMWEEHRRVFGYTILAELPFRLRIALEGNPGLNIYDLSLIAVDEFQDLNECDLACIHLLGQYGVKVLAVGDPDQSIFKFRGANPQGILNFVSDYESRSYPLTTSHRCGRKILQWANFVICGDTTRKVKSSLRAGEKSPVGLVKYLVFNREESEARGAVRLVKWLKEKQEVPLEEILILVRTNMISNYIKKKFEISDIPLSDPYDAFQKLHSNDTRMLLATLRLSVNRSDSLAWWTIFRLKKGLEKKALECLHRLALENQRQFGVEVVSHAENEFSSLETVGSKLANSVQETLSLVNNITVPDSAKWGDWIMQLIENEKLPNPDAGFSEILEKIDDWPSVSQDISLEQYLNQIEPLTKDIMNSKTAGRVRIMTLTRSKGLTARATIIVAAEKGIMPFPKGDPQEERRLLYVGMTRAREYSFITRARRRIGQTARSGETNVAELREQCPFLDGGPVSQCDGDQYLASLGV
ncbi:MAG: ATP-dependent helicase [bacterium]